ncbi:MAG: hypothetical protein O3B65_03150 [Chloroflexi bacterium]|nr:hypothetical protein [Chloroflexota bacterium]
MSSEPSGRIEADAFIEAAHPIPLQVDRDVVVAERTKLPDDALANVGLEGTRQFLATDLEPREVVVMPDAAHPEAEITENAFRALDRAQLFGGDLRMVRNP